MTLRDTLKQLAALREKATPLPWKYDGQLRVDGLSGPVAPMRYNINLMLAAVNALPALLEMLSKLEGLANYEMEHLDDCGDGPCTCWDRRLKAIISGGGGT